MFVFGGGALRTFSSDSSGQLDVFGHDGKLAWCGWHTDLCPQTGP